VEGEGTAEGGRHCSLTGGFSPYRVDWKRDYSWKTGLRKSLLEKEADCGCIPHAKVCTDGFYHDPPHHEAQFCKCAEGKSIIFGNPNGWSEEREVPSGETGMICNYANFQNPLGGDGWNWKHCYCIDSAPPPIRKPPPFSKLPVAFEIRPEISQCR
jgi:hypothetical protein